jgi:hypothetical protein
MNTIRIVRIVRIVRIIIILFLLMVSVESHAQAQVYGLPIAPSNSIIPNVFSVCHTIENLVAADDDMLFESFVLAVTVQTVWCNYKGSAPTTIAEISLEDGAGNAMTHSVPVCAAPGTAATEQAITAVASLTAKEVLRFDVDNTPNPATDTYMLCVSYTVNLQ